MNRYLQEQTLYPPFIHKPPAGNLGIVVVIPAYQEPHLQSSLMALLRCQRPRVAVELIVVLNDAQNSPEEAKKANQRSYQQLLPWAVEQSRPDFRLFPIYCPDLPGKYGGVGLARKIGMDEACYRFAKAGITDGLIACFDADSRCASNYLVELERQFALQSDMQAASIYFEHPLQGAYFPETVYEAITTYELHRRYLIHAQRWAGFPFAYHTMGSSMAVRHTAYQAQGGMNKRKADEDFYFLHKFIELGKCFELNTTAIYPSPRPSDRVPFGTGKAIREIQEWKGLYPTYATKSFEELRHFFQQIRQWHAEPSPFVQAALPLSIQAFLAAQDLPSQLDHLRKHTASEEQFITQFFRWFNASQLIKYLHFARDHYFPDEPLQVAARWLLENMEIPCPDTLKNRDLLLSFRSIDKKTNPKTAIKPLSGSGQEVSEG